jgi:Flp pilus assembly protein TadG
MRGVAAVEFAILAPLLILMLIAMVDLGIGILRKMQVENAAHAGGQYAMLLGFNSSSIATAVSSATSFTGITVSPAPTKFCGCPTTSGVTVTDCSATCTGGSTAGSYVTVSAQAQYDTLFSYPMIPKSFVLTAQSTVRIQ